MITIGQDNTLTLLRSTSVGLYLGDNTGEEVLLPNKYCPEHFEIGEEITVFVYRDYAERKIATTLEPHIKLHEFAFLQVTDVSEVGAFLDWGLEKDLLVPFREQRQKMEKGRWYVVFLALDERSYRLFASNKIDKYLSNEELSVTLHQQVSLLVSNRSEMGYTVIVNNRHKGLIYANEVFKPLHVGDQLTGYVKNIREDQKLDISLHPIGYNNFNDANVLKIIQLLEANHGLLNLTDKSDPSEIYALAGMSKKAFKKAVGALYKAEKIVLKEDHIALVP
ncbi:MAG: GntR family transcriptional regulator [Bacteroidetes bacterium]|nr:MAG: GntR family transcriptional regulator [Bacteroidota bacterium]